MHFSLSDLAASIPFLAIVPAAAGGGGNGNGPRLNVQRITEAVIIAGITGALVVWGNQMVIGEKVTNLQDDILRLETRVEEMRRDIYRPRFEGGFYAQGLERSAIPAPAQRHADRFGVRAVPVRGPGHSAGNAAQRQSDGTE